MNNSGLKTTSVGVLFFSISVFGYNSPTSAESWNTSYEKLFEGIAIKTEKDGLETREVVLPGPVRVRQTRRNGKVSTFSIDESGKGAILCSRELFYSALATLEACSIKGHQKTRARLRWALGELNEFVMANSIESISIEKIEQAYDVHVVELKAHIASTKTNAQSLCSVNADSFIGRISQMIEGQTEDQFRNGVEASLSVPRLPVMNPCF